ncbi:MAG: DNA recombination protein RmuC [Tidjanibacter sp.]|nr:DNA recombination protein RmuC [Tidjanibacter sp.]
MEPVVVVVAVVLALVLGIVLMLYLHPNRRALSERTSEVARLTEEVATLRSEATLRAEDKARLEARIATLEPLVERNEKQQREITSLSAENARLQEQLRQEGEQRANLRKESEQTFKELATAILDEKSQTFKKNNEERLGEILAPFKANLEGLQKKIEDCYTGEVSEVKSLRDSLKQLTELNATISREARELSDALRGNSKVQGDWGEMILRQILEKSGLEEGVNFTMQATHNADGSKIVGEESNLLRPDVIFHLPEGKHIVIDSKVSLTAYVNYVNATAEEERERELAAHVLSVTNHVKELTAKQYQRYVKDAADFVMMFVPNEGAYMAAMNADTSLWEKAYAQHVVIISPTHLISVLKLMYQLWTRDKQTKNALLIAEETGKLYDKLCGFVKDLQDVGSSLTKAQEKYNEAYGKLSTGRGNLLKKAEDIKSLGIKTAKQLPADTTEE